MRQHRVWAAALLGAAALLLAPAVASAQVSIGVGRFGVSVGTPYYGYYPGYYSYGYSPSYYSYGYSPSYYSYGYSPSGWRYSSPWYSSTYYPSYSYMPYEPADYYSTPARSYSYSSPSGTSSYYSYGAPAPREADTARLTVHLPDPDAQVWIEDKETRQRGSLREFVSPPLNPDKKYTYEVRARWTENGKEMERTKSVPVRANGTATVDFTAQDVRPRLEEIDRPRTDSSRDRPRTDGDRDRPRTDNPRPGDTRPPKDSGLPDRP
jgi:uncharacterized protein (TIGR03000 family)